MFIPAVQGGHAINSITLDITSNTSNVNILTLATAAGYSAGSDTTAIIVNVASGVNITATSGNPAMRTGALNAASDLTINLASSATICGVDGASTTSAGAAGGAGGDAILFEITSGTGTYSVVNNGTHVGGGSGGGGGGGSGGSAGARLTASYDGKGGHSCVAPNAYGSAGSQGSHGSAGASCRAQAGSAGGTGSSGGYPSNPCGISVTAGSGGAGGAGGAAGKAVNKGGLTVTTSGSGTYYGATS